MAKEKLPAREDIKETGPARAVQRKPYSPPRLTIYGHISKLTMSGVGSGADGGTMTGRMKVCL